jgi:hypothetical protein
MGVSFRAEVETTIEGGVDREYTKRGRQRGGGGEENTDSGPVASNIERARVSVQTQTKKEGNILVLDTVLSSTKVYCCRMVAARVGRRRRKVGGERGREVVMREVMATRAGRDGICSSCLAHVVEREAMDVGL